MALISRLALAQCAVGRVERGHRCWRACARERQNGRHRSHLSQPSPREAIKADARQHGRCFRECDPSIIYGVYDTLWAAGRAGPASRTAAGSSGCSSRASSRARRGPMELITGVSIVPQDAIADVEQTDIVFVPNVVSAETPRACAPRPPPARLDQSACTRRARRSTAACGGSLVLAEAGLLDGLRGDDALELRAAVPPAYPNVTLREERILVQTRAGPQRRSARAAPRRGRIWRCC